MRSSFIVFTLLGLCGWISACGSSPSSPSETQGTGLQVSPPSVRASLEKWAGAPWDIGYSYCYSVGPAAASPEVQDMIFRRVDYSTIGPTGIVYDTSSDTSLVGRTIGGGYGGCFFTYRDPNITRPVATTYRITFQYATNSQAKPTTQTVSGTISSTVPPPPYITNVTLTSDINDPQRILRQRTPITFTVTNVEGGTPPFLYQWRLNGFVLRDWDPNSVLTWDGATLNGRPVGSGSYTLGVYVRRSTWPEPEGGATVDFLLLF